MNSFDLWSKAIFNTNQMNTTILFLCLISTGLIAGNAAAAPVVKPTPPVQTSAQASPPKPAATKPVPAKSSTIKPSTVKPNPTPVPSKPTGACVKGEVRWSTKTGGANCCKGLVATSEYHFRHPTLRCDMAPPETDGNSGYCVVCGDGKCDRAHYETDCSCPKDCR